MKNLIKVYVLPKLVPKKVVLGESWLLVINNRKALQNKRQEEQAGKSWE